MPVPDPEERRTGDRRHLEEVDRSSGEFKGLSLPRIYTGEEGGSQTSSECASQSWCRAGAEAAGGRDAQAVIIMIMYLNNGTS